MHPLIDQDGDNDFTNTLATSLREFGVDVDGFSWRKAFFSRFDVLHVHWPEALVRAESPVRSQLKALAFASLIAFSRARRRRLVATVHNLRPHERTSRFQSAVIRLWYRAADDRAYFTKDAVAHASLGPGHYIPHQSYSVRPASVGETSEAGAVITFGYVRRYKRLEAAIAGVSEIPELQLSIVGMPVPEAYGRQIASIAQQFKNIRVELGSVPFSELVRRIRRSEFVLLPYENLYSSGAAMLALSAGRPVILVASAATLEMQAEFGPAWIGVLPVDWTSTHISNLVEQWRGAPPAPEPDLSGRTPDQVAILYRRMYEGSMPRSTVGHR